MGEGFARERGVQAGRDAVDAVSFGHAAIVAPPGRGDAEPPGRGGRRRGFADQEVRGPGGPIVTSR
ncbi:hypothetical protein Slala03_47970 [Streptomyces lavendulae subsp. lavendulae]|nr:hypothetical protein Slala03_47970 [Streptomyces lavendulae subsp. lavendulae]